MRKAKVQENQVKGSKVKESKVHDSWTRCRESKVKGAN